MNAEGLVKISRDLLKEIAHNKEEEEEEIFKINIQYYTIWNFFVIVNYTRPLNHTVRTSSAEPNRPDQISRHALIDTNI
jgi:hypothetical protein